MSTRHPADSSALAREDAEPGISNTQSHSTGRLRTRVLVIGSGIAGLHTAWRAAEQCTERGDVVLLTKRSLFDSATSYAQGGIAAARGAGDSPALHRRDTLAAGGILCDRDAVDVLVSEGPRRVRDLHAPAAHYTMGGIVTDLLGRTSIARLSAVGEVARTGVHGANRLASNSLLEGLVFAERVAHDVVTTAALDREPERRSWSVSPQPDRGATQEAANRIRALMWEHAGITRTAAGLRACLAELDHITAVLPAGATEEANLALTARLVAESALAREESRGGHYRADFPYPRRAWASRHVRVGVEAERRAAS